MRGGWMDGGRMREWDRADQVGGLTREIIKAWGENEGYTSDYPTSHCLHTSLIRPRGLIFTWWGCYGFCP